MRYFVLFVLFTAIGCSTDAIDGLGTDVIEFDGRQIQGEQLPKGWIIGDLRGLVDWLNVKKDQIERDGEIIIKVQIPKTPPQQLQASPKPVLDCSDGTCTLETKPPPRQPPPTTRTYYRRRWRRWR